MIRVKTSIGDGFYLFLWIMDHFLWVTLYNFSLTKPNFEEDPVNEKQSRTYEV